MKPLYLILLLLMNFFWAAAFSAYKIIGEEPSAGTGAIVTLRFGLAGLCLLAFWPLYRGPAPKGRALLIASIMGVILFVLGHRLQVYGNILGTAGNSSVLMAVEPLITSVAAALFLQEHVGPRRVAGSLLSLLGVVLLNRVWSPDFHWTGIGASLIFIASFVCEAAYSVIGKPIVQQANVMKVIAISLLVATVVNLAIDGGSTFQTARQMTPKAWMLLLLLAVICTAVGYSIWFVVIKECPVNVVALTVFSQAVFGTFMAWAWVGEKLHWGQLFGCAAIVAGLALGLSRQIKPEEPPPPVEEPAPGRNPG